MLGTDYEIAQKQAEHIREYMEGEHVNAEKFSNHLLSYGPLPDAFPEKNSK